MSSGRRRLVVGPIDRFGDRLRRRHDRLNMQSEHDMQVVQRLIIGGIRDRHAQHAVFA
jgi:hypothetical protein